MAPIIPAQHPLLISPLLSCNLLPTLPFLHGDLPSSPLCPVPPADPLLGTGGLRHADSGTGTAWTLHGPSP